MHRSLSEGDRRRTYWRLVPGVLDRLGSVPARTAPRVVFVCTANSARSHPADRVHPGALAVARRHRMGLRGTRPVRLDTVSQPDDLLVAVCDYAHEHLLADQPRLHWSVPDPVPVGTSAAFDAVVTELTERIDRIAPHVRRT